MSGRKLAYLIIVISLTTLTVFMVGCTSEEEAENEQDKNDLNKYEVVVQTDTEEAGEIEGEGTYEEGEEVTVEAEPKEGY
ncbi:InlB B-repeat-containing protein [Natranaerobius trueperi]|uniref:Bacterial repeat domain-containing protein n=1 Tax=Natranaerobius trueperi TaxID=759412 RepID=A0A226C184_9FIRM|nr:hypothetical protein [Natranaerobius trueperi]OWZ84199.1 hypothetical protein CDO51_04830 [Natranaerobius trueperi]